MSFSPTIFLVLAPLFWSINFLIGKTLAGVIPPASLTLLRWIIALALILPFTWSKIISQKKNYFKNWDLILLISFLGYCLNSLAALQSLHFTAAINASFIASFNPIVFAVLAYLFYKEKLTGLQATGIVLSMLGVFWIIFRGDLKALINLNINLGDAIMLISVFSFAIHSLLLKKKSYIFHKETILAILILGGIISTIPFVVVETINNHGLWLSLLNKTHLVSVLALGIFPSFLSFYCWNKGLEKVPPSQAATFLNLIPVFTTLLSILFLGEELRLFHVLGGLLIFIGVMLVNNNEIVFSKIVKFCSQHGQ